MQVMCDTDGSHAGFTLPNPKKLGAIRAVYTGATAATPLPGKTARWGGRDKGPGMGSALSSRELVLWTS